MYTVDPKTYLQEILKLSRDEEMDRVATEEFLQGPSYSPHRLVGQIKMLQNKWVHRCKNNSTIHIVLSLSPSLWSMGDTDDVEGVLFFKQIN